MEMEMDSIVESYTDSDVEQVGHDVSSNLSYFPLSRRNSRIKDALQSNNLCTMKNWNVSNTWTRARLTKSASAIFKSHPCECEGDKNSCELAKP